MTKYKIKKYVPLAVFSLMSFILLWQNVENSPWKEQDIFRSDIDIYYTYLPAAIVNKDPLFELEDEDKTHNYRTHVSSIGRNAVKMSMGVAIMELPFFMVGHLYALSSSSYIADGYSVPYHFVISFSSALYTVIGLLFLWLFLRRRFSKVSSLITVLLICFGTNLYFYAEYETGMSHPYTFFLLATLLYLTQKWLDRKRFWKSFVMGLVLGLIILIRPINILFILPIFILFKEQELSWNAYLKKLFLPFPYILTVLIGSVLIILPQLIFWKIQTGSILYYSYEEEGFFWLNPHVWEGLFSFRKGWFIYTPLMFFTLFGMIRLYRKHRSYFWSMAVFLPLFLYVTFSWWAWWYGGGFGARTLVDILPFMAIPLAGLMSWILEKKLRFILLMIPVYLVYVNLYQSWQYSKKMLHYDSMTYEGYKTLFLKHYTAEGYWEQLRQPDYENALKYGVEKEALPIKLAKPTPIYTEEDVQHMMDYIRTDKEWMDNIERKAKNNNQPVDSVLRKHVIWLFENEE